MPSRRGSAPPCSDSTRPNLLIWRRPGPSNKTAPQLGHKGLSSLKEEILLDYSATCILSVNLRPFYGVGVDGPRGIGCAKVWLLRTNLKEPPAMEISRIGIDTS